MRDKAIGICSRLLEREGEPEDHEEIRGMLGSALLHKGEELQEKGNFEGATEAFNKLLVIQKETVGEMHYLTAETYERLAAVYREQEMHEDRINALIKSLEIHRHMYGDNHPRTTQLACEIAVSKAYANGNALNEKGLASADSEQTIKFFQKALDIFKGIPNAHSQMAGVYENIAAVKAEQGLMQDAVDASAEAVKICRRTLGDDHDDTKVCMGAHKALLIRLLSSQR